MGEKLTGERTGNDSPPALYPGYTCRSFRKPWNQSRRDSSERRAFRDTADDTPPLARRAPRE